MEKKRESINVTVHQEGRPKGPIRKTTSKDSQLSGTGGIRNNDKGREVHVNVVG